MEKRPYTNNRAYPSQGGYNQGYNNPEYNRGNNYAQQDRGGKSYRGGGAPRGGKFGASTGSRPTPSIHSSSLVPRQVNLVTNQYLMKLGTDLNVFYYDISIIPEIISDAYVIHGIFRNCKKQLEMMLGIHVLSGRSIFTTTDLSESIVIKAQFKSQEYDVVIDVDSKRFISGKHVGTLKMEDHSIVNNLINIIIKQAFRETNLRQIGKAPRFFDVSRSIEVKGSGL